MRTELLEQNRYENVEQTLLSAFNDDFDASPGVDTGRSQRSCVWSSDQTTRA